MSVKTVFNELLNNWNLCSDSSHNPLPPFTATRGYDHDTCRLHNRMCSLCWMKAVAKRRNSTQLPAVFSIWTLRSMLYTPLQIWWCVTIRAVFLRICNRWSRSVADSSFFPTKKHERNFFVTGSQIKNRPTISKQNLLKSPKMRSIFATDASKRSKKSRFHFLIPQKKHYFFKFRLKRWPHEVS